MMYYYRFYNREAFTILESCTGRFVYPNPKIQFEVNPNLTTRNGKILMQFFNTIIEK